VLFGDPHQLPPIDRRGTVLDAFVASGSHLVTPLVTNYRSAHGLLSFLTNLRSVATHDCTRIRREWFHTPNSTIDIVPNNDNPALYAAILLRLQGLDPKTTRVVMGRKAPLIQPGQNHNPTQRAAFLSAMHMFFNPTATHRIPGVQFYVGDLVRSTRNVTSTDNGCVELLVTNGSEGIIASVNPLSVVFGDGYTITKADDNTEAVRGLLDTLECGFLSTVHKFQGSEAETIIAVFMGHFVDHNTIQLLYTAVSRSRQQLCLIMEQQNYELYCKQPGHVNRNQRFNTRLMDSLGPGVKQLT
jgi:hypothetical protein